MTNEMKEERPIRSDKHGFPDKNLYPETPARVTGVLRFPFIIHHSSEGMPEGFFDLDLLVFAEHAQEHDRVLETFEIQVHE